MPKTCCCVTWRRFAECLDTVWILVGKLGRSWHGQREEESGITGNQDLQGCLQSELRTSLLKKLPPSVFNIIDGVLSEVWNSARYTREGPQQGSAIPPSRIKFSLYPASRPIFSFNPASRSFFSARHGMAKAKFKVRVVEFELPSSVVRVVEFQLTSSSWRGRVRVRVHAPPEKFGNLAGRHFFLRISLKIEGLSDSWIPVFRWRKHDLQFCDPLTIHVPHLASFSAQFLESRTSK